MQFNTLVILRKELIGKKLIMYDNVIWNEDNTESKVLCRTFQASKRDGTNNVRVELIITDINEANREAKSDHGCHFQIETGSEVHPFYYYSKFEIED